MARRSEPMKSNTNAPFAGGVGNVGFMRDELRKFKPQYDLIRDCIDGETVIKSKGDTYLPRPNPADTTKENRARFDQYVERAVFYNATRRTLAGLLGEIFAIDPVIKVPTQLEPVTIDATGGGVTLIQQAMECAHKVLAYSRAGIFIDFPARDAPLSQAEIDKGDFQPTITIYDPVQVINWRSVRRGSKLVLNLVVIEEYVDSEDDGFEVKKVKQWRVLKLVNDVYQVTIYSGNVAGVVGQPKTFTPKDADGNTFSEIPFRFAGAKNNDAAVDPPLLYDLASLNIAHYRNSADYEESSFTTGQPMYWFSGLTANWFKDVLKGKIEAGSRAAVPLPVNGSAGILQPEPNNLPFSAMEHKERQMVALGAKLVENRSVQRTASEATMDQRTENSILSTAANNVSDVIEWALGIAAMFVGAAGEIVFKVNTEFAIDQLSAEDQVALVATWQAGAIALPELRDKLRKSGIATMDDAEALPAITKEQDEKSKRLAEQAKAARPEPVGNSTSQKVAKGGKTKTTKQPTKKAA